ncbi:MAG: hypothetical protein KatS3mg009_2603 [Acidimicrobiia bacterium]|nr:MAG: hypothetical protein KatS3mg009_2603 [Acidimicrobiia bacterium]
MRGRAVVAASWASVALFAAVAVPDALGAGAFDAASVAVSAGAFFVSLPAWAYAFGLAIVRSARGDDIAVANLFFLSGSAPPRERRHLLGAVGASVVVAAATAAANPAAVLVPMLPLGLAGCWAARHGTFPPRRGRGARR